MVIMQFPRVGGGGDCMATRLITHVYIHLSLPIYIYIYTYVLQIYLQCIYIYIYIYVCTQSTLTTYFGNRLPNTNYLSNTCVLQTWGISQQIRSGVLDKWRRRRQTKPCQTSSVGQVVPPSKCKETPRGTSSMILHIIM